MFGDFRPFSNNNVQIWDHFFPLLFPKNSESLTILDIQLQEVGAKRYLNGSSKVNTQTDTRTHRRTNRLIESIGKEDRCFEKSLKWTKPTVLFSLLNCWLPSLLYKVAFQSYNELIHLFWEFSMVYLDNCLIIATFISNVFFKISIKPFQIKEILFSRRLNARWVVSAIYEAFEVSLAKSQCWMSKYINLL